MFFSTLRVLGSVLSPMTYLTGSFAPSARTISVVSCLSVTSPAIVPCFGACSSAACATEFNSRAAQNAAAKSGYRNMVILPNESPLCGGWQTCAGLWPRKGCVDLCPTVNAQVRCRQLQPDLSQLA